MFYLKVAKQFTTVSITATSLLIGSLVSWRVCARLRIWVIICWKLNMAITSRIDSITELTGCWECLGVGCVVTWPHVCWGDGVG